MKGVCRVLGPVFLEWKKIRSTIQKPFDNCSRVSGPKLNVSEYDLKLVLYIKIFY